MKKKLISLVTVGALLMGGLTALVACGQNNNQKGDSSINQNTKYQVTYNASEQYEVTGLKDAYAEGETVTFKINLKDNTKQISSVKVQRTRIRPNENGEYSFTMPNEDVEIAIEVGDMVLPELYAFYEGKPTVGETLTFTTKIDLTDNSEFTITPKSGSNLVEVNNHQVRLLGAGVAVLEISASKDGTALKTEVSLTILESEASLGQNIAYTTYEVMSGAESMVSDYAGTWINWAGDGGSVSSFDYIEAQGQYVLSYSTGWAFYSVQLFYSLPYAKLGDRYKARWEIDSDVAGDIQINGQKVTINKGYNYLGFDITQGNSSTISMQFGYQINDKLEGALEGGSIFKFKPIRIYDTNSSNNYYHVTFTSDNILLKDIYVRGGEKVSAPYVSNKGNMMFSGFFDGTNKFDETVAPTANANYVAQFVQKTAENTATVILMLNGSKLTEIDVYKGNKLVIPDNTNYGFGKQMKGLFRDTGFAQQFDLNSAITENLTLYVKTQIVFDSTYVNDAGLGYKIPTSWITYNNDGSTTLKFNGWGSDQKWHIQANFTNSLMKGRLGDSFTISFVYSINYEGADAQVYDGNTLDMANLEVGSRLSASVTYEGGEHAGDFKLTFEFGSLDKDAPVEFTLHSIDIAAN